MRFKSIFVLSLNFIWIATAGADSFAQNEVPAIYSSNGAEFLVRVEADSAKSNGMTTVVGSIMKFDRSLIGYRNLASFSLRAPQMPGKVVITDDGKYVVLVIYGFESDDKTAAISVVDNRGSIVWSLRPENIWTPYEFKLYSQDSASRDTRWIDDVNCVTKSHFILLQFGTVLRSRGISDYLLDLDSRSVISRSRFESLGSGVKS